MQIKFYLNKQKTTKHGDHPVYMYITYNGKRIRKPVSGVHSKEKGWDSERERIRRPPNSNNEEANAFNNRLDQIEQQINLIRLRAFEKKTRLSEKHILDSLGDESLIKADQHDFFSVVDQYLESIKSLRAANTNKTKKYVFKFLQDFQTHTNYELSLHDLDIEFFERFRNYAFGVKKIGDNSFSKIVRVIKTFLAWTNERGYSFDQNYKKFKAPEKSTEIICLNKEELLALLNHSFESKKLSAVRDVFVFACSTGLRFSDLKALKASNIQGDQIKINIQKTREDLVLPLNNLSKEILKRYEDSIHYPLPQISNQKFNEYLKECCKSAGIDTPISITRFSGGNRIQSTHPKWELITSHAGRKTFVTLSLLGGAEERAVKNATGHKKEESFRRYVNYTREYEKRELDKVWNNLEL